MTLTQATQRDIRLKLTEADTKGGNIAGQAPESISRLLK